MASQVTIDLSAIGEKITSAINTAVSKAADKIVSSIKSAPSGTAQSAPGIDIREQILGK